MSNIQRAIHFDMDGVITDTEHIHMAAELQACKDFGLDVDETQWNGFKGKTAKVIFEHLIAEFGNPAYHDANEMIQHKTNLFVERACEEAQPIDGVMDFLDFSRRRFDRMNLVTSSNRQVQECLIGKFGLTQYFDAITTGDDVANGKPHPEPYLRSIGLAGIAVENSVVVEDSKSGIASGHAAGCHVLAVTTSYSHGELETVHPRWISDTYLQATNALDEWMR